MSEIDFLPFIKKQIVSNDLLAVMNAQCQGYRSAPWDCVDDNLKFCNNWNRRYVHNDSLMQVIHHNVILGIAEKHFKRKLKPSYVFLSMYEREKGNCPVHTDRPQCRYTVDLVINQDEIWPFYAGKTEKEALELNAEVGDAIFLSGTDHVHFRKQIQKNNNVDVVFFHFVDPDFEGELK